MPDVPDIYFLSEWGKYYEAKEKEGEWTIFEFRNDLGHISYSFILRPIPLAAKDVVYRDIITPFGFSGPVILACEEGKRKELVDQYDKAFQQYCEEHGIVAEYVRFNPWIENSKDFESLYHFRDHGDMMYVDLTVGDFFMDEFSPKARTQVRKAQKNKVEIEFDFTGSSVGEFLQLYELTAQRNQITDPYYLFSEEFLLGSFEALKGRQFLLNAKYEGQYISSCFVVHHGEYMHSHMTANNPDFFHLAGNSLVHYEACRWGVENRKRQFQLGGTSSDENLYRFKRGFTKTPTLNLLIGMKIRNQKAYDQLVELKKQSEGLQMMNYFPLYRG